jgi:AcrR family transcriptional regulator
MKFVPRSESTRQFIIETTAGIFNTKGYAGTSMSDLTEATGLTKGSIYGNFENKEEVALAVFDYNSGLRDKIIRERLRGSGTNKEKLLAFSRVFSSAENKVFPAGGCPLLNAGTEADDTHEALRLKVAAAFRDSKKELTAVIRSGIAAKEFREDIDVNKVALSVIALIEGGILMARTARNTAILDTVLDTVNELIEGICVS